MQHTILSRPHGAWQYQILHCNTRRILETLITPVDAYSATVRVFPYYGNHTSDTIYSISCSSLTTFGQHHVLHPTANVQISHRQQVKILSHYDTSPSFLRRQSLTYVNQVSPVLIQKPSWLWLSRPSCQLPILAANLCHRHPPPSPRAPHRLLLPTRNTT